MNRPWAFPVGTGAYIPRIDTSEDKDKVTISTEVPLADRVVIKKLEAEEKTAGGIVIPDSAKEKPQQGEVLAVGPGKLDETGRRICSW